MPWIRKTRALGADSDARFSAMNLQPVDDAQAVLRPFRMRFYGEDQYDAHAREQLRLWQAKGKAKAEKWRLKAAETKAVATAVLRQIGLQWARVEAAERDLRAIAHALEGFTRRGRFEKARYFLTTGALLFGDVAGVGGAAIYLGEEPGLAVCQAIASGVAAVTAGLVGQELKDSQRARRRAEEPSRISPKLARFAHLFRGADAGESIVKAMTFAALSVAAVIAVSIFALRYSTEGITAGFVFGGLAAAISLASFINTFTYADDIADLLDQLRHAYRDELKRHVKLAKNRHLRAHHRALAAIDAIEAEHQLRGEAAQLSAVAEKYSELSKHPGVAGHGYESSIDPGTSPEADASSNPEVKPGTEPTGKSNGDVKGFRGNDGDHVGGTANARRRRGGKP